MQNDLFLCRQQASTIRQFLSGKVERAPNLKLYSYTPKTVKNEDNLKLEERIIESNL